MTPPHREDEVEGDGESGPGSEPPVARAFARAVRLPAAEREAFLETVAREDPEGARTLRRLLAAHSPEEDWLLDLSGPSLSQAWAEVEADGEREGSGRLAPGTRIGVWEIREPLGMGGMGVVYRARDTELDRWAALKFPRRPGGLPSRAGAVSLEEQILREARAAAALDHPNIGVVFQVGRVGDEVPGAAGRPFLAMAFYEGETLRSLLEAGPHPLRRVLGWAAQLASALEAAHAAGLAHGDIKAENLLLTPAGLLKVLDFGLAAAHLQEEGRRAPVLGTPAVLSPERAAGGPPDVAGDLWAAGVVLFEALSGEAFRRPDPEEAGRLEAPAAAARRLPARLPALDLPTSVANILLRLLAPEAADRYGDAATLRADLEVARRTLLGPGTGRPGVAVLPFTDSGAGMSGDYFVDGVTEEVIHHLSEIRGLRVISRSSVMRLKGSPAPAADLAEELGVRYVVEGGVRRAGDRLRVAATLVDTASGEQLWSGRFHGTLADVFEIQESVARGVARGLAVELSRSEEASLARRPIADIQAWDVYLRARHEAWRFSGEGLTRAMRFIEQALEMVGDNALLHATLGHLLAISHEAGVDPGPHTLARVEAQAARVFELEPGAPRGDWLLAFAAMQRGDMAAALAAGERALAGMPDDADTLILVGYIQAHVGRTAEALQLFQRAETVDPLTPLTRCMPGFAHLMDGNFQAAVQPYRTMYELDPDSPFVLATFGWVLALAGETEEALPVLHAAMTRYPGTPFAGWARGVEGCLRGDTATVVQEVEPLERAAAGSEMFARAAAQVLAMAGEEERALNCLEQAVELGLWNEPFLARHDPWLEPLRSLPRFEVLMDRVRARLSALESST